MRTEQLWECLAAICVHTALTMYRWCVLTDRLRQGEKKGTRDSFGYFSKIYSRSHVLLFAAVMVIVRHLSKNDNLGVKVKKKNDGFFFILTSWNDKSFRKSGNTWESCTVRFLSVKHIEPIVLRLLQKNAHNLAKLKYH